MKLKEFNDLLEHNTKITVINAYMANCAPLCTYEHWETVPWNVADDEITLIIPNGKFDITVLVKHGENSGLFIRG